MSELHARLGPSNHRWPHCPGSVREEAAYPDVPGEAAIDGTGSHILLELCLVNNVVAETYDGQIIGVNHPDNLGGWMVGPDRIARVQMCLDYVDRRVKELREAFPGAKVLVAAESKADPGGMFGRDDWWGTVDITITVVDGERCRFIEVIDYKDGRGWVHAADNTQLLSYMAGKLRPWVASGPQLVRPFRTGQVGGCRITIVQPKTNPVVRYDEPTPDAVIERAIELDHAADATDDPNAPLIPDQKNGKGYCQWCKHKHNCTALAERSIATVRTMSTDVIASDGQSLFELVGQSLDKVKELSESQLAQLADAEAGFMSVFARVKEEIEARINNGHSVPGFAIENGKGSNVWNDDEDAIVKMLKARKFKLKDIYPPKLISPAQVLASKLLDAKQKERIEKDYITYKAGKPTLKKVAYEKVERDVEMMFADVPKDVAQSQTSVVDFTSSPSLFDEPAEVSFL